MTHALVTRDPSSLHLLGMLKANRESGPKISFVGVQDHEDPSSSSEDENSMPQAPPSKPPPWDMFKYFPPEIKNSHVKEHKCIRDSVKAIKVFIYGLLFCLVLVSGVVAKSAMLFMVAQLREEKSKVTICDEHSGTTMEFQARISNRGRAIWMWYVVFVFFVPECFGLLHGIWYFLFNKRPKLPKKQSIAVLIFLETLHPIGLALLLFLGLPRLDSVQAGTVCSCLCFVPALLGLLSLDRGSKFAWILFDIFALVSQSSQIPLLQAINRNFTDPSMWICSVGLVLSSCRWWNNYVSHRSRCGLVRYLSRVKTELARARCILEAGISIWRSLIFLASAIVISSFQGVESLEFFSSLQAKRYEVELISSSKVSSATLSGSSFYADNKIVRTGTNYILDADSLVPFYVFLVQVLCSSMVYQIAKFAYRTQMHRFGFALPLCLITPGTALLVGLLCLEKKTNPCAFRDSLPRLLFFEFPEHTKFNDVFLYLQFFCWLVWWISQIRITRQLWSFKCEKLASADKIFCVPTYDSTMIDQFLALNKQRWNDEVLVEGESSSESKEAYELETGEYNPEFLTESNQSSSKRSSVTRVHACATMWHEKEEEMSTLIGSLLRLDKEQSATKYTQNKINVSLEDYYQLETHIFFDDAFRCMHGCTQDCDHDEDETHVNRYVLLLSKIVEKSVEGLGMRSSPPIKFPTPYGGRLVWILPGNTHLTVHLKDKNKIRPRKRWSQVMYMYYLLGYHLMDASIDVDSKESMAENTYILTLDGDIDFRPEAVRVLIDLMKKDKDLGAACGRIHPVGKGLLAWFQKFEYAIGHWLQKSTEHTIGSVLCSPGCFSLFRAKILMQNNVMAKYAIKSTEPRHYVQYDQGEDRWLCTLILQVGGRVEYTAACDAYTHAPQAFRDFYIQRKRWIPSTLANMFDLLSTSKTTRKLNNNISWLYIVYQWALMGSTILGPGTIFLMLVGAFVSAFHVDNWTSFFYNLIPIGTFILTCFFCKERIQLLVAEIITAVYSLVMMVVLAGIALQIGEDGWFAPSSLLFFIIFFQMIITGFLHPRELSCLLSGLIYYMTVPSMYMILVIFSIFNLNNVSWGTRESSAPNKTSEEEPASTNESKFQRQDKMTRKGRLEFSLGGLFKCGFSAFIDSGKKESSLDSIQTSISQINIRLRQLESHERIGPTQNINSEIMDQRIPMYNAEIDSIPTTSTIYKNVDEENESLTASTVDLAGEHSSFLINPHWTQDERMRNGKVDFLSRKEEKFWEQLIEKYLYPIEIDKEKQCKLEEELKSMRNEYLYKFFMLNAIFVLVVFLLQLNKNVLHVHWPLGVKYNITYDKANDNALYIKKEYLRLEPIGCLFIASFISILLIQFLAMLSHRLNTFSHILANTKLNFCVKNKKQVDPNAFLGDIVTGLQRVGDNEVARASQVLTDGAQGRKSIRELIDDAEKSPAKLHTNFEKLFTKRLSESASGLNSSCAVPKPAVEAFQRRRSEILAERRRFSSRRIYDQIENLASNVEEATSQRNSQGQAYDNLGFDP